VEPFGSFASDLFTRWADLDISIDLLNSSCISSAGKRRKQRLLVEIQRALINMGKLLLVQAFCFCLYLLNACFSILPHY
jgi:hypothetical protein